MSQVNTVSFAINQIAKFYGVDYSVVKDRIELSVGVSKMSKLTTGKLFEIWESACSEDLENQLFDLGYAA